MSAAHVGIDGALSEQGVEYRSEVCDSVDTAIVVRVEISTVFRRARVLVVRDAIAVVVDRSEDIAGPARR